MATEGQSKLIAQVMAMRQELERGGDFSMGGVFTLQQAALFAVLSQSDCRVTIEHIPLAHVYAACYGLLVALCIHDYSSDMSDLTLYAANAFAALLEDALPGAGDAMAALQTWLMRDEDEKEE